jgi:hypothetical protein
LRSASERDIFGIVKVAAAQTTAQGACDVEACLSHAVSLKVFKLVIGYMP